MRRVLITVLMVAFLLGAVPAHAAAPVATGQMDVQMWPAAQADQPVIVIASIVVSDTVSLPATVQFPIPTGMKVDWAGEIVGTDPSKDIQKQPEIKTGENGQYAEFEIGTSRQAQVEFSGGGVQRQANALVAGVDWVQSVGEGIVDFSIRMPTGAQVQSIEPQASGSPQRNSTGETLYTLTSSELKLGQTQKLSVSYTIGQAQGGAGAGGQASGGGTPIVALLIGALAIAGVALFLAIRRQSAAPAEAPVARRPRQSAERGSRRQPERPAAESQTSTDDEDDAFRFDD